MKRGYLSQYFKAVAIKRLSAVEIDAVRSHQHEINGDRGLRQLLGECGDRVRFESRFVYLGDSDAEPVTDSGFLTWYDARQKARLERGVERSECRLYFPDTAVTTKGREGDLLIVARMQNDTLIAVFVEGNSTAERQVRWLFGFTDLLDRGFSLKAERESDQVRIEFAARFILEQIGVEIEDGDAGANHLDILLEKFGPAFPTTKTFSAFARETLREISARDDPDRVLLAWMEREELLFRTLERHLIGDTLRRGFGDDVDAFIRFSLSVQNRRKSRVGAALENNIEEILKAQKIQFSRAAVTENRSKPDFLFPGLLEYRDAKFPVDRLSMLGVKSTCKDRWRQVLAEADRIPDKHLLTLEPGISEPQTDEMRQKRLQLVLPAPLHTTYSRAQQKWLMNVGGFVAHVARRQNG